MTGRREFTTLFGGAGATWPLAARAQQPAMPMVGFLNSRLPDAIMDRLRGFRQGLKDTGYFEGENVETRSVHYTCTGLGPDDRRAFCRRQGMPAQLLHFSRLCCAPQSG